jgi:microsomal epoxide hydrolase
MRFILTCLLLCAAVLAMPISARAADRMITTSDGVKLHVTELGVVKPGKPVLMFVPGWTMPGWIFQPQIDEFSKQYHVVVLDPRGQGQSDVPISGYTYDRRGADIGEVIGQLGLEHVVLVGWSLGVLDSLAYVHSSGDAALAGLVLIDNSVGENPPPAPSGEPYHKAPPQTHAAFMASFVRSMFHHPQTAAFLNRLTEAALRTPERAANALLAYTVPRTYWKEAVYATTKPVFYVVRPKFAGQANNLAAHHPGAETMVMADLGHALFVDDPKRFNAALHGFLDRRVAQ